MQSARTALQLSLGKRLPDNVLELILSFGWHLWLREPWSFLARNEDLPILRIPPALWDHMDYDIEWYMLRGLCDEYKHIGDCRDFKIVRCDSAVAIVPLSLHTLSVVPPRKLSPDTLIEGTPWRPEGWRVYLKRVLPDLDELMFALRPTVAPYGRLSMTESGPDVRSPIVYEEEYDGDYRPLTVEDWLRYSYEGTRFLYRSREDPEYTIDDESDSESEGSPL